MARKQSYEVKLSEPERNHIENLISSGTEKARKLTRARILLKADEGWIDQEISRALDVGHATVGRIRKVYAEEGLERALNRKPAARTYARKVDGSAEAHLIALTCSDPPEGYARWTLRLLSEHLVELKQVEIESLSHETVRRGVKKNELKPWQNKQWVIPPQGNAEFVCAMEDILELYQQPRDPLRPLVCLDEGTKQLISETRTPLPMQPGQPLLYDYEYERHGTANLFMFFAPLEAWRHVKVTDQRTMIDYAHCLKDLSDIHFPDAESIQIVQDNLNIHTPAALYQAFEPAEARRLRERFVFHYTPKHGSWLNMAEIELNVISSQCLDRRIACKHFLVSEVAAWQYQRNLHASTVNWQFTTAQARIKLRKLYPSFHV
ncbi:MAG: IS630 family transposase [Caldilineaceae bacterium]